MKTKIVIKGQIMGNSYLRNKLTLEHSPEIKKGRFGNYILVYPTKKEAVDALSIARQSIKEENPDYYKDAGVSYMRGDSLSYDASVVEILKQIV